VHPDLRECRDRVRARDATSACVRFAHSRLRSARAARLGACRNSTWFLLSDYAMGRAMPRHPLVIPNARGSCSDLAGITLREISPIARRLETRHLGGMVIQV